MNQIVREKEFLASRFNVPYESLSASYLRLEKSLGTQGSIAFDVLDNKGTPVVTEKRLKQNDMFIITHIGFGLKKIGSDTPTDALQAPAKLYTYVNNNTGIFDGTNDANLQAIYNGFLEISVDRKVYMPAIDMRSFERVPDTQEGQILAAITGPTTYAAKRDAFPNGLFGYFPTDYIKLNGYDNLEPVITLPASVNMDESSETNYAVLLFKGYLASGQAKAKQ